MACCPTEKSYGYESCRFEKDVDENFHCSICYNVLKEPRTCRNNEHMFCLDCITEHLNGNSQTCAECNEHLSVDTLRRPRVLNNILSKLKIKCDYASRGCPEFVRVEELQTHVENCGFAPVLCSNEECGIEINKHDKVHHETEVCEYRKVECLDCGMSKEDMARLEGRLMELDRKVNTANAEVKNNHVEMKKIIGKLEGSLVGINKRINGTVEAMNKSHEEIERDQKETIYYVERVTKEVEEVKKGMRDTKEKVEAGRGETKDDVEKVKKEVKDIKEYLSKVNKDIYEVKVMMSQILDTLNMLKLLNKLPSSAEEMVNTAREDILIAGGYRLFQGNLKSTEIYSWGKNCWFKISEMNEEHAGASSFIHKDQLFVVGGDHSKTVETLDLNELPLKWMKFPGELPYECGYHQSVVLQQRIIYIGGYDYDKNELSNVISELQLSSPCIMKELFQMPEPRQSHGAEIFEDKLMILGGENRDDGALDSVLEFNVTKNGCNEMPALPHALTSMETVRWRDKVVVLGGINRKKEVLNDVLMYDCKTGKITALPSMLEKRLECCAVITGNTIVVMGGWNENGNTLSSVECFTVGGSTWKYLPDMNEARCGAIAHVLPPTWKYV